MIEKEVSAIIKQGQPKVNQCYNTAHGYLQKLSGHLHRIEETIQKSRTMLSQSQCYISGSNELLNKQLSDLQKSFSGLENVTMQDLGQKKKRIKEFSITLFGRTMAGKSTLMEILTNGNGSSIGKGAQRTTRDVREYKWNSLSITDVPGIGAFEGEEDEDIAFQAAKSADLVLFLITADAPQPVEAQCLGRVLQLGKPVLCLINVKAAVRENSSMKMTERDINRAFDLNRLEGIKKQFLAFAAQMGQEWGDIPFVYSHLLSAFLAKQTSDPEKKKLLYELSRFSDVENAILTAFRKKGLFYRMRSMYDIASVPLLECFESLLTYSKENHNQGNIVSGKIDDLSRWKTQFLRDSQRQIQSVISSVRSAISGKIAQFAEEHFSDPKADEEWGNFIKQHHLDKDCETLMSDLNKQCDSKLQEITRSLSKEIEFYAIFEEDERLRMSPIINGRKIWDWSFLAGGGILTIGAGIAFLAGAAIAGPLGWIALGVGILGAIGRFFFKSRETKEREAREALEKKLRDNLNDICKSLQDQMEKNLQLLIEKKINAMILEMQKVKVVEQGVSEMQRACALTLNYYLKAINKLIVSDAFVYLGAIEKSMVESIVVARVPGNGIVIQDDGLRHLSSNSIDRLQALMNEPVYIVHSTSLVNTVISNLLQKKIMPKDVTIATNNQIATVKLSSPSPKQLVQIRLAQQITELLIICE